MSLTILLRWPLRWGGAWHFYQKCEDQLCKVTLRLVPGLGWSKVLSGLWTGGRHKALGGQPLHVKCKSLCLGGKSHVCFSSFASKHHNGDLFPKLFKRGASTRTVIICLLQVALWDTILEGPDRNPPPQWPLPCRWQGKCIRGGFKNASSGGVNDKAWFWCKTWVHVSSTDGGGQCASVVNNRGGTRDIMVFLF